MHLEQHRASLLRFGNFELDTRKSQLRNGGVLIKLQPQPMAVLQFLAESPGELLTREQIHRQVWGDHTFVDFDRNLNVCMAQIRAALNDDANSPRYIRTVPKRGYMFLSPVERILDQPAETRVTRRLPWRLILAIGTLCALSGAAYIAWPPSRVMLAVLPFEGTAEDGQLVDGLTDELISHLGSIRTTHLGVIARSSVMRYKTSRPGLREVARELGIQYVLEGAIQHDNDRVRVTARLVKVSDQALVWTESYEDDEANLFRVEQDSAARITAGVEARLFPQTAPAVFHATGRDAYEAYRTGRTLQFQGSLDRSLAFFDQATRLDPKFADAYAALADSCVGLARSGKPAAEFFPRAAAAAGKALELDPGLAEGLNALANVRFWFDWNWTEAERLFKHALAVNSSYAPADHDYAWFLVAMGRTEAGLASLRRAIALDPFSVRINMDAGWLLLQAHRFDDAIRQARRALELAPGLEEAQACIAAAQHYLGHPGAIAASGGPYSLAAQYASKGETNNALDALEKAYQIHFLMMPLVKVDPAFTSLHADPRFIALVERVGIK